MTKREFEALRQRLEAFACHSLAYAPYEEVAGVALLRNDDDAVLLLAQALAYGRAHGASRAFLAADECNTNALHLYQRMGFVPKADEVQIDMLANAKGARTTGSDSFAP